MKRFALVLGATISLLTLAVPLPPSRPPAVAAVDPGPDFNGDGFADLAIGIGRENPSGISNAGAVHLFYGGASGLSADRDEFWHQDTAGVPDAGEMNDLFGAALAVGDFDGDGFDDLAIGASGETVGGVAAAGAVTILYGSAGGLTATGSQWWHQDVTGILGTAKAFDRFGSVLSAGDFDGNGFDDLAIGVPAKDPNGVNEAGAVSVLYGSAQGLKVQGNQVWHQDRPGIEDVAEPDDQFGSALAAGDFDMDGRDDLAVGLYQENIGAVANAGAVNVIYGSASGLTADGDQFWSQASPGIPSDPQSSDNLGHLLAVGDFNGDDIDDLVIPAVDETLNGLDSAGVVHILYGSGAGLSSTGNQFWHQDRAGVLETAEVEDYFGDGVAAGDLNGDGFADLLVTASGETVSGLDDAGAVHVLFGSASRLTATGNQLWHQDSPGVPDQAEANDLFGWLGLLAADFNGDGFRDVAIGVPAEDVGTKSAAGAVLVLYSSAAGPAAAGSQFWHQDKIGVLSQARANEQFGQVLGVE